MGKKLVFLPSCHSTNEIAEQLIAKDKPVIDGTLIITAQQLAGKGQRGNSWESEPGMNLTFSLILKPRFLAVARQFDLNMAVSLGICDYLNTLKKGFLVKWPNDIYYNENKICGILIQNMVRGSQVDHSIIGIGLNVNQEVFKDSRAVSLATLLGQPLALEKVLESLVKYIEARYLALKSGKVEEIKADYLHELYHFGEVHLYKDKNAFSGKIVGVSETGLLQIESKRGLESFNFKEVSYL